MRGGGLRLYKPPSDQQALGTSTQLHSSHSADSFNQTLNHNYFRTLILIPFPISSRCKFPLPSERPFIPIHPLQPFHLTRGPYILIFLPTLILIFAFFVTTRKFMATTIITFLFATGPLVSAAPADSSDPRDLFQLEKRCQGDRDYCDGAAIRCCAGNCCTDRHGGVRYCEPCENA
ncbi:uncharacterized protein BDV17DRAFT_293755 [Aspergillus undulatus]|uniref:uncharacterized protein n=1 Tax=Aspergillus undulatus TaxID=1810928 RepID=UPI003CCD96E0